MKPADRVRWIGPPTLKLGPHDSPHSEMPVPEWWKSDAVVEHVDSDCISVRTAKCGMDQGWCGPVSVAEQRWEVVEAA